MSYSSRYGAAASRNVWQQYKKVMWFLIVLGVVVFGGLYLFSHDQQPRERAEKTTTIDLTPSTSDHERYKALYEERLNSLERQVKDANEREQVLKKEMAHMKEKLELKAKESTNHPFNSSHNTKNPADQGWPDPDAIHVENNVNQPEIIGKGAPNRGFSAGNGKASGKTPQAQNANPSQRAPRLVLTDVSNTRSGPAESILLGKTTKENKSGTALTYLTSGTFAKARLLNGATAPTRGQGSGNPVPVLLELTDAAIMPNLYRSGIQKCFVTANATGELASERVLIRLERLSCIDATGGAIDTKIQGYVSGEDGKTGLRARLVTKSGQAIANALITGALSGLGKAVSLASQTSTTSGITGTVTSSVQNPWRAGFGEGTSKAMDRIADYYLKLASDLFPVLEVDSGREVEIVLSQGLSIERLNK